MSAPKRDSLPFEEPLEELRKRIEELLQSTRESPNLSSLVSPMQAQYEQLKKEMYENLSPWNTVQVARHPKRPQVRDYIEKGAFDDFVELHGDRQYRDDGAIVTGLATVGPHRIMLVGQHKGRTVEERHVCHAGCPHPEGYWKALRKMKLAERFGLPVVCLIDTKGAYPGIGAEERGVAIAIAENLRAMSLLRVPVLCIVIGEGGSGGALGIGVGDRVLMLRYAYYSVISPEGCASILWRDGEKKAEASAVLKLTSRDLLGLELIDGIVDEPMGGAHYDPPAMVANLRAALIEHLDALAGTPPDELVRTRYEKFRAMGRFLTGQTPPVIFPPDEAEAPAGGNEGTGASDEKDPA